MWETDIIPPDIIPLCCTARYTTAMMLTYVTVINISSTLVTISYLCNTNGILCCTARYVGHIEALHHLITSVINQLTDHYCHHHHHYHHHHHQPTYHSAQC